jgi:Ca2+-binding RTX toxin-like protein
MSAAAPRREIVGMHRLVIAALTAGLALPSAAQAGTVSPDSFDDGTPMYQFVAGGGEANDLEVSVGGCKPWEFDDDGPQRCVRFYDRNKIRASGTCSVAPGDDPRWAVCPRDRDYVYADLGGGNDWADADIGDQVFVVDGGDGDDYLNITGGAASFDGGAGDDTLSGDVEDDWLSGGDGEDSITGSAGADTLLGGDGKDSLRGNAGGDVIDGGAGPDSLYGNDGADVLAGDTGDDILHGGAGDDRLDGGDGDDRLEWLDSDDHPGADDYRGGAGLDQMSYGAHAGAVAVTIDDQADDGGPGEGDNVHADIEFLTGSAGNDQLTGNDGANRIDGGSGNDAIFGLGGDDALNGGRGDDTVDGGSGHDSLYGDDECAAFGCGGADRLVARDGLVDNVSCGPGADTAVVDSIDVLAADPQHACEAVDSAAASVPTPPTPPTPPAPPRVPTPTPAATAKWKVSGGKTRVTSLSISGLTKGAKVTVTCTGKGCPFKTKTVKATGTSVSLKGAFKKARLRAGAKVTVKAAGKTFTFTMRKGSKQPKRG